MNEKLATYLDDIFAPYEGVKSVAELKADLLADLQERFRELKAEGRDDTTAFEMTIESIGDIEQTVQEVANLSRLLQRQVLTNFSARNLPKSDFAGVIIHNGNFTASALRGANFAGADLTGSTFTSSDARESNFDGTNLTDCKLSTNDLTGASFRKSILVRTNFSMSALAEAKFIDVNLTDANLAYIDLRKTIFEGCTFNGVDFKYSDLRGMCLDRQTFISVKFEKSALAGATFRGATFRDVDFRLPFTLFNKYIKDIKAAKFDDAKMDKLTYAALKGIGVDLSKVTVI
jgi:uncharacterized protein YjbI with pentapeptide repeats